MLVGSAWPPLPRRVETVRLVLRPFGLGDVGDVFEYAQDAEWARFLPVPQPYARADAEQFVAQQVLDDWNARAAWAIEFERTVIGGINVHARVNHRRAEMGYGIARDQWGKGLATEAARAAIETAFNGWLGLNRIEAYADIRNPASLRVMEKSGMRPEGVRRLTRIVRGEVVDDAVYAILREEWERHRRSG